MKRVLLNLDDDHGNGSSYMPCRDIRTKWTHNFDRIGIGIRICLERPISDPSFLDFRACLFPQPRLVDFSHLFS